jgi:hypothetical protein
MAKRIRHGLTIDRDIERKLRIGALHVQIDIDVKSHLSVRVGILRDHTEDQQPIGQQTMQIEASADEVVEGPVDEEPKVKVSR